jgi:predicted GNAT superfamily acetyltransferase
VVLDEVHGRPVVPQAPGPDEGDAGLVAVATPPDVETLRHTDPGLAHAWRVAVREALEPRLRAGRVAGFTRGGSYLVTPGG